MAGAMHLIFIEGENYVFFEKKMSFSPSNVIVSPFLKKNIFYTKNIKDLNEKTMIYQETSAHKIILK